MGISRRVLLRRIGAAAAGAAAAGAATAPAFAGAVPLFDGAFTGRAGPIRLDRNENAYGPSLSAIAAMQEAARTAAFRYPKPDTEALRDAIARIHHVSSDRIVLGCGATEILRMTADVYLGPGKQLVTATPTL